VLRGVARGGRRRDARGSRQPGVVRGKRGDRAGERDLHAQAVRRSEEREAILSALKVVLSGERLQDVLDRLVGVTAGIAGSEHVHVLLLEEGGTGSG